jgi:phage tail sheath gpL-like
MSSISIPITGLAANDPVPGEYIEVNFAQGQASSGNSSYDVLLMGNKLSTGSAGLDAYVFGPDTATPMTGEADAIALFGAGSELHRMVRAFLKVNNTSKLYAIAVTESAGSQATGTISVTGTASGNGTLRITVGAESVDSPIVSGDSVTTIAAAAKAAINSKSHWAVTADNSSGDLTITAKQKGLRGNLIRYSAKILSSGSITSAVTPSAHTLCTGGTTADDNTAALATILPTRFYYIVPSAVDATQLGAVQTQIDTQAGPLVGLRQRMVAGSVDSLANATTIATGLNGARSELVWQASGDVVPSELAAKACAGYALFEASTVPRLNFNGYGSNTNDQSLWDVKKPLSAVGPTRAQILSALNNGITPVAVGKGGATSIVKRITCKSVTASQADYRTRDAHIVTVIDFYADDLQSKLHLQFAAKQIGNDPAKGQSPPGANVATPRIVKAAVDQLTREYGGKDLLENVSTITNNTVVIRETSPTTRMSARIPLDVADILNQIGAVCDQVG